MGATGDPVWLPTISDLGDAAQLVLVAVAVVAAFAAFRQVNAFKLFELTKFLQEPRFQDARRTVLTEIKQKEGTAWWEEPRLEAAASICCGHYDIVGTILQYGGRGRLTRHFARHWGKSIILTYDILHGFLERRRATGGNEYRCYDWLYQRSLREWPAGAAGVWPVRKPAQQERARPMQTETP
jgi:hypothetical protein